MSNHDPARPVALDPDDERMRSIVDHVVDAIISIDDRGIVVTFNPAAERMFGWRADEVIGRNVDVLMPEPYHSGHDQYVRNYLATGRAKIIGTGREVVGRRRDGTTFPMELAVSEFHAGGRRFFTGIVRDITERKLAEEELRRAEERMRSVVDHVLDGIIVIDARGDVQSLNPAAEKLFGYARDEVVGRNVSVLMPQPYRREHDGYLANYLGTGHAKIIGTGREVVGQRKDGSTFPMELAVAEYAIGGLRYFTGIVRDITERKRLENELRHRVDELAEADRQKNEFLAMLAHELRNPLAPLRNALHLMRMPGADRDVVAMARDMMDRQLQQLVRLVDDLLDVSRIIRGRIELKKERLDVAAAVERAIETAQPVIEAQGHGLSVRLPDRPIIVEGDLVRLSQVIANLLTNAAKYTDRAGAIAIAVDREGDEAVVRVSDTGMGIDPALKPRIFELFVQGDATLARPHGGLGIGLTLVKRLTEMHGGRVSADSEGPGKGSVFSVRLPALPEATEGPSIARAAGRRSASRRVLVVDDNVDAAESIGIILRMSGYDVKCVYDGRSALEAASAFHPDVFVLDIGLPGMDGYEVARTLRRQPEFAHAPIVAVTGYGQEDDRRRAREAGFDHHMTKPVDPSALQAFVADPAAFGRAH